MKYSFSHTVLGGTFDHFHKGHKHFLSEAFKNSLKVTIGITNDEIVIHKKQANSIESFNDRKQQVLNFLKEERLLNRSEIIEIKDIFGTTLEKNTFDSLFVIPETQKNGELVNMGRKKKNLKELIITVVPTIPGPDGKTISSTRIRNGEIDRDGNTYKSLFEKGTLKLPDSSRSKLKNPFGIVSKSLKLEAISSENFIIAVGDIVVSSLIKMGLTPNVSIFDGISNRSIISDKSVLEFLPKDYKNYQNKPGTINSGSALALESLIKENLKTNKNVSLKVKGEEDLLALPAILFAPLDSYVIYGLKDKGAVTVVVTEDIKENVVSLIKEFK